MTFFESVKTFSEGVKTYVLGKSGQNGQCDCIGLIIGSLALMGIKWTGTHGTNYAVRNAMQTLEVIDGINSLSVNDIVYKRRFPGETGYALPSAYKNDPDKTDYYHVGVVLSVNPLDIVHCTTGKDAKGNPVAILHDSKLGKWSMHGTLKLLADGTETKEGDSVYTVVLRGGNEELPINLRAGRSITSTLLAKIPQGTKVDWLGNTDGWAKVIYDGKTGFVQVKFVKQEVVENPEIESIPWWLQEKLMIIEKDAKEITNTIEEIVEKTGRG